MSLASFSDEQSLFRPRAGFEIEPGLKDPTVNPAGSMFSRGFGSVPGFRHSWNGGSLLRSNASSFRGTDQQRAASEKLTYGALWGSEPASVEKFELLAKSIAEMEGTSVVDERRRLSTLIEDIRRTVRYAVACGVLCFLLTMVMIIYDVLYEKYLNVIWYYFAGSVMTLVSALYVFVTYYKLDTLNRHPSSLHIWGTVCDILLAISVFIQFSRDNDGVNYSETDSLSIFCSFLTQVALLGSVTWFMLLSWDLLSTLRNPFVDHTGKLQRYHAFAWTTSILSGVLLLSNENLVGVSQVCINWIKPSGEFINANNWGFYYIFIIFYVAFSIAVLVYCMKEWNIWIKNKELELSQHDESTRATLEMRSAVIKHNAIHVIAYVVYYALLFVSYFMYAILTSNWQNGEKRGEVKCDPEDEESGVLKLFAFLLSGKGVLNAFVWYFRSSISDMNIELTLRKEIPVQYRKDVLKCTLMGIRDTALMAAGPSTDDIYHQRNFQCLLEMNVGSSNSHYKFVFRSYAMLVFRHIRERNGITTEAYMESICGLPGSREVAIAEELKETFSEGKSGAFLYFSRDRRFIIKTMSEAEANKLMDILKEYHNHLERNPDTLITRLYGLHSIVIYGVTMFFVVMENVIHIPGGRKRTHTFDLKGSWVDRETLKNGRPNDNTDDFGEKDSCFHAINISKRTFCDFGEKSAEPAASVQSAGKTGWSQDLFNKTLKDIDFRKLVGSISLGAEMKSQLIMQIKSDTDFFCSLGIMDYSLLLAISEGTRERKGHKSPHQRSASTVAYSGPMRGYGSGYGGGSGSGTYTPFFRQYGGGVEERVDGDQTSLASGSVNDRAFHIGIIDLFQEYTFGKKAEHWFKAYVCRKDPRGISCVPPELYAKRFVESLEQIFE